MTADPYKSSLGACYLGEGRCRFLVWAPYATSQGVSLLRDGAEPIPMVREEDGYYSLLLAGVAPGTRYRYLLNGDIPRPDPASRYQPDGVHGPSEVIDPRFPWTDEGWGAPLLEQYVFYELHTGTFSLDGTFDAIVPRLEYLKNLGITAIELMPVAQFPGQRNWGYDGVYPFAAQNSYGGPAGLKRLVDSAHRVGLAVVLDVVYNHLGPEGNYFRDFGPYFTDQYKTPWGEALNFDGPDSDEVRRFFIGNALHWIVDFHIDALRLDAIHAIVDPSARPFVQELAAAVHEQSSLLGRRVQVIAESDLNDVRVIRLREQSGLACDAVWNDNFHHALHSVLTGERDGYYQDFGTVSQLATAWSEGFVYSGQYSPFRRRRYGNSARGVPGECLVVCSQNHDQVGNRPLGERTSVLTDFESLKLAAGAVLFSPYLPLLFMGEEYGETAPFQYFTDHSDSGLIDAVRRGRSSEFAAFAWKGEIPDPQDEATFLRSRLSTERTGNQEILHEFYKEALRLRREFPALAGLEMERCQATALDDRILLVRRWCEGSEALLIFNFSTEPADLDAVLPKGIWMKVLHSADSCWNGNGEVPAVLAVTGECRVSLAARSLALYERF